jgi:hypothetical protein
LLCTIVVAIAATTTPASAGVGLGVRGGIVRDPDDDDSMRAWGGLVRFQGGLLGLEVAMDRWERDLGPTEVTMTPVTASLLLYPIPFAYVGAGAGRYGSTIDSPGFLGLTDDSDASDGYHVGAGLEVPLIPQFRLMADARYMFVDRTFDELGDSSLRDSDVVALQVGGLVVLPGS